MKISFLFFLLHTFIFISSTVLRSIESSATRYGRYIVPLISISVDFYIRMFIQVHSSPLNAKRSASRTGLLYLCKGCHSFNIQPMGTYKVLQPGANAKCEYNVMTGPSVDRNCKHCDSSFYVGGPIFIDSIHDQKFIDLMMTELEASSDEFATYKRMYGMLQVISEELNDVPLYWTLDELCRVVKCPSPSMDIVRSAIMNAGYRVSYSHANSSSIKTNAPHEFMWDFMKKWIESHPCRIPDPNSPVERLLSKSIVHQIDMNIRTDVIPTSKKLDLVRYQCNPEPNWGPKPRPDNKRGHETLKNNLVGKKSKIDFEES